MEFPNIGKNCSYKYCNRLDFLPMKCDACRKNYCSDHFTYVKHDCLNMRDVRVPVCPLCGVPVPGRRGEPPDVTIGAHIENQCIDPAKDRSKKIYVHQCSLKGCKTKEMIQILCSECRLNFCLRHRHTTDHVCEGKLAGKRRQAAEAAMARLTLNSKAASLDTAPGAFADVQGNTVYMHWCSLKGCKTKEMVPFVCSECALNFCRRHRHMTDHACERKLAARQRQAAETAMTRLCLNRTATSPVTAPIASANIQGNMTEDEALAHALALSMQDQNISTQERDRVYAALARQRERDKQKCCGCCSVS